MATTRRQLQEKLARLVNEYAEVGGTCLQGGLRDLLTDLRRLAAGQGLHFDFAVQGSGEVFGAERAERSRARRAATQEDPRREAADRAFEEHDFGDDVVAGANGWEHSQGHDEWSRVFFVENPDGGDSSRQTFTVRFKEGAAEVVERCWG